MRQRTLDRLDSLYRAGRYEEAEAGARALASAPRGVRRRPAPQWCARALATAVAVAHGRGTEVPAELEMLIVELKPVVPEVHVLQLEVRHNRTVVLLGQERYEEAEAEAVGILRAVTRLAHLAPLRRLELHVLENLAGALCGQARHEEAEAIARGNLPRADGRSVGALQATLVRSLNGQGRYEEALAVVGQFTPVRERANSGRLDLVTGWALYGLGRRDEAAAAVRQTLADCERNLHQAHPRTREARTLLGAITGEG
ncbi:tetratricopeptide repeat protein [Streptomyces sp. NPDC006617]|uniref:tetratricopeptide repeat protein n=1 Tax=Streptomyces sp. NPDC006617 TaxID=3155354 RepID=UPI0033BE7C51